MFRLLRKYFNYCRYWILSLISDDPYVSRIKSLEEKILSLHRQPKLTKSIITFTNDFGKNRSEKEINIFQPNISQSVIPSMVTIYREREQYSNLVGDYIGDYNSANKNKDYSKAQSIYDMIVSLDRTQLNDKAKKKLDDFISKV